jgi:calcineurin-like phosphoesterase family protein
MAKAVVISDLHFGHKNILKYRTEFSSIEEHDGTILDNIKSQGSKRNTLWLLGDCFFSRESFYQLDEICQYYENVNLVAGNHDTDSVERQSLFKHAIRSGMYNKVGGLFKQSSFWMSHAPIHPLELRGCINVHGHVHSNTIRDPNYINVSCENVKYKPVNLHSLKNAEYRYNNLVEYGECFE